MIHYYIIIYKYIKTILFFHNFLYTKITPIIHFMAQIFTKNNNDLGKDYKSRVLVLIYVYTYMSALFYQLNDNYIR